MNRETLTKAAAITRDSKTAAGKMSEKDLDELLKMLRPGAQIETLLTAYNAGYYRGALAAMRGQFQPGKGVSK